MAAPRQITGILIDPYERTVTQVQIDATMESYYRALHCSTVESAYIFGRDANFCYVDEEGLMGGQSCGFETQGGALVMGRGLVLRDGPRGTTASTSLTVEKVRAQIVNWIGEPEFDVDALVEEELLNANPLFGQFG